LITIKSFNYNPKIFIVLFIKSLESECIIRTLLSSANRLHSDILLTVTGRSCIKTRKEGVPELILEEQLRTLSTSLNKHYDMLF
jgi:hypothetical protein